MKQLFLLLVTVSLLFGCNTEGNNDDPYFPEIVPPNPSDLPAFPEGSTPATTAEQADAILEAFKNAGVLRARLDETDHMFQEEQETESYSPNYNIIVESEILEFTAIGKGIVNFSSNYEQYHFYRNNDINFTTDDFGHFATKDYRGFVGKDNVTGNVTTVAGSRYASVTVATGLTNFISSGNCDVARVNRSQRWDWKDVVSFTVETESSSLKIIFYQENNGSFSEKNVILSSDTSEFEDFFDGYLRLYGQGDTLLREYLITDSASHEAVWDLLC